MPDATGATRTLTITRRSDDTQHVVLYDAVDVDLVTARTWRLDNNRDYVIADTRRGGSPRRLYLHRIILGLTPGDGRYGDHINGNTLDNRRRNLRATTNQVNISNQAIENHRGLSRYRGVYWNRKLGRWAADVRLDYRKHYLGSFATEEDAAAAAAAFRAEPNSVAGY